MELSRKDGDSEPVAVFDIEIRNYVRENKEKIMMMMRTWKKFSEFQFRNRLMD